MNMSSIESKIKKLTTADDLPQRLEFAMRTNHQGAWGRGPAEPRAASLRAVKTSPQLGYGRHFGPAPHTNRPAAVMLLLYRRAGHWHIPLTERSLTLAHHAGQISLPGGAVETGESSIHAALRELNEELGFARPHLVLGRLADCYVFASDFLVTPWVIASLEPETSWRPHDREVQSVVELPLDVLFDDQATGRLTIERGPLIFHAPCIRVGPHRVWGATSIILNEFAGLLRQLLENN
jgi:8-oxo-dGTP pyrophosphatase MutT (NUDIX family)